MTEKNKKEIPNLLSVRLFTEQFPTFSTGCVRSLIWNEDNNGLKQARAIKRIGKRILIDVDEFFLWIDEQNTGAR